MGRYLNEAYDVYAGILIKEYINQEGVDIFHYTSPKGLDAILKSRALRFSDRYYLNDYSEGRYVMELCKLHVERLIPNNLAFRIEFLNACNERLRMPQAQDFYIYQCSFSISIDSLCLWNYYTKGDSIKGFNIGFNSKELCDNLKFTPKNPGGPVPTVLGGRVIYNEGEQLRILEEVIKRFMYITEHKKRINYYQYVMPYLIDKLMFIGIFMKKPCFAIEEEYRIAFDLQIDKISDTFRGIKEKPYFYEKNGLFIPYTDISFSPKALKRIGISPTLDLDTTQRIILRVIPNDYSQIRNESTIIKSDIPVRY